MKYLGSKSRVSKELVPIIQKYINDNNIKTYIEPFVGGANIIDKVKCKHRVGSDIDNIPISLFNYYVNNADKLDELPHLPTKGHFYDVRNNPLNYSKFYRSAILLFASYNARVYGGCYGAYATTKAGNIRNYFQESIRNFKKQIPNLTNIEFYNCDYRELDGHCCLNNCVIYCDIPYKDTCHKKEYLYEFDHYKFYDWCIETSKNNVVLISEYNMPSDKFECIWQQEVKTHLNNRNKQAKIEKLFIVKQKN